VPDMRSGTGLTRSGKGIHVDKVGEGCWALMGHAAWRKGWPGWAGLGVSAQGPKGNMKSFLFSNPFIISNPFELNSNLNAE
jgi:hypothetical protein